MTLTFLEGANRGSAQRGADDRNSMSSGPRQTPRKVRRPRKGASGTTLRALVVYPKEVAIVSRSNWSRCVAAVAGALAMLGFLAGCPVDDVGPEAKDGTVTVGLHGAHEHEGRRFFSTVHAAGESTDDLTAALGWGAQPATITGGSTEALIVDGPTGGDPVVFAAGGSYGISGFIDVDDDGDASDGDWIIDPIKVITVSGDMVLNFTYPANFAVLGGIPPEVDVRQGDVPIAQNGVAVFGAVNVGASHEVTFTIENTGNAEVYLLAAPDTLATSGPDASLFEVTMIPTSPIPSGGTSRFSVRFSSETSGQKNATVALSFDDAGTAPFVFTVIATAFVPSAEVPITGITTSQAGGDDGDLERGVGWPEPRFQENGDDTITDSLTGLMWEQAPTSSTMTWAAAIAHANDRDTGGYLDWRLPNVNELRSLCNYGTSDIPAWLLEQGFLWVHTFYYWSSTPYPVGLTYAWVVFMPQGQVLLELKVPTATFWKPAWSVRGGR